MQFEWMRRAALIALLFIPLLILTPMMARAESITLNCFGGDFFVIDLTARTARELNGRNLIDVSISDSTISFVDEIPGAMRRKIQIDRTSGSATSEYYYYPGGGASGPAHVTGQCTKAPNKVF
jgi:hypothetical protein